MNSDVSRSNPILPVDWLFFALLPALPFLLGAALMQLFAPTNPQELLDTMKPSDQAAFTHLGDRLTFAAAAILQMTTCVSVMFFHLGQIRQLDVAARRVAYRYILVTMVIGVGVAALIRITNAAPYQLTFNLIRELLLQSPGLPQAFAAEGFFLGQSRLFYSAFPPFLLGVVPVALAIGFGATVAVPDNVEGAGWESSFSDRVKRLQTSFQALSLVLVTSTVTLMLFVQIPAGLIDPTDKVGHAALSRFALGMTLYWGSVMTLTLLAIYLPPFWALRRETIHHHQRTDTNQTFGEWISERKNFSVKQHLTNLATMLAPILVGPVGILFQSLLGT